jgi:PAC2 family
MSIDEVLVLDVDELAPLHSPVLLIGLTGWFDVAGAATGALAHLTEGAITVGEIDADPFYDFTQERPTVEQVDGETRRITWPTNDFEVVRTGGAHDLVVLTGVEPHLAWPLYISCARHVVERLGCEAVVTLGATADAVPHTRLPPVIGSTADPELARRLALSAPTYQGITGLIGALHVAMERAGVPTISLRVGIPHYLTHLEHPLAVAALVQHLAHVLGLPLTIDVREIADRWRVQHDEIVADDDQLQAYVRMLEIEYDRRAEATLRRADDIAEQFEAFLRDQREHPGDPPS